MAKILKVKAVGESLVHNFNAFAAGRLQFVGRKFDLKSDSWLILPEGEEVPFRAEYLHAVKEGDLEPLDDETCRLCGVPALKALKK